MPKTPSGPDLWRPACFATRAALCAYLLAVGREHAQRLALAPEDTEDSARDYLVHILAQADPHRCAGCRADGAQEADRSRADMMGWEVCRGRSIPTAT